MYNIIGTKDLKGSNCMNRRYPLRLEGINKTTIWGGDKICSRFGGQAVNKLGERWILSARENEDCIILNGLCRGMRLTEYLEAHCKELLPFPLLIKFIDANDRLSVQVHPDDDTAVALGDDTVGKTEMWHIIEAEEGATIVYGIKPGISTEELRAAVDGKCVESVLNFVPVKAGDTFFIPAGLVHAIGKGILLAEVQQNSDTTYRFYDYGRLDASGNPRQLHVEKALTATKLMSDKDIENIAFSGAGEHDDKVLADCRYFKVYRADVNEGLELNADEGHFLSLICLGGSGRIAWSEGEEAVSAGDSFFIPPATGEVSFKGSASLLISTSTS